MGGRGGSSGFRNNSALQNNAPEIIIETYFRRSDAGYGSRSGYKQNVLEAVETSRGEIKFRNAQAEFMDNHTKANTRDVQFKIRHGAVYHKSGYEFHGINWDNVSSVSGDTYAIREEIKERGFRWDKANKRWIKRG